MSSDWISGLVRAPYPSATPSRQRRSGGRLAGAGDGVAAGVPASSARATGRPANRPAAVIASRTFGTGILMRTF